MNQPLPRLLILPALAALLALSLPASPAGAVNGACICAAGFPLASPLICYEAPGARIADFAYAPGHFLQVVGYGAGGYCRHNGAFTWLNGPDTLGCEAFIGSLCHPPADCADLQNQAPSAPSGAYLIDPDGPGGTPSFPAYCDQETDGGGWTLVARFSNADAKSWMLDTGEWWYDRTTAAGDTGSATENLDMLSPAFWSVPAGEFKITRTDNPDDTGLFVSSACLGPSPSFRDFVTQFGDFRNGTVWGMNSVEFTCPGAFANNFASTDGFEEAMCSADIGAPNSVSFWTDWSQGDGAVMMVGGGGSGCSRADHGIGVTEANSASFGPGPGSSEENDFGDDGDSDNTADYGLNLFVR